MGYLAQMALSRRLNPSVPRSPYSQSNASHNTTQPAITCRHATLTFMVCGHGLFFVCFGNVLGLLLSHSIA